MERLIVYIHGKGGSASEAAHYIPLFPGDRVVGLAYHSDTPWDAETELRDLFIRHTAGHKNVLLIANSIGAYFAMHALRGSGIERAFFISPIVDMERLILDMLVWAGAGEQELRERKEIPTTFGETLSWEYLSWVRNHPILWNVPTEILRGERDQLQSAETVNAFAARCGAGVTVMQDGEHWFHTGEQLRFLDSWLTGFTD